MTYANYETRTIETSEGEKMVFDSVDAMYKYLKATVLDKWRVDYRNNRRTGHWIDKPFIFKGITK
jgi:hypothetical protein